ncbi:hypothetical protein [Spirosoma harenae]
MQLANERWPFHDLPELIPFAAYDIEIPVGTVVVHLLSGLTEPHPEGMLPCTLISNLSGVLFMSVKVTFPPQVVSGLASFSSQLVNKAIVATYKSIDLNFIVELS